jgi:hypothetical protein
MMDEFYNKTIDHPEKTIQQQKLKDRVRLQSEDCQQQQLLDYYENKYNRKSSIRKINNEQTIN